MQDPDARFAVYTNKKYSHDAEELDEVLRLIVRVESVRRFHWRSSSFLTISFKQGI